MDDVLALSDCLLPEWPAAAVVKAVFTTRAGGVSTGAFASLNLGLHVGDDPSVVQHNRQRLAASLGAEPQYISQVHGSAMVQLGGDATPSEQGASRVGDGSYTTQSGVVCTVMVADCLPILLCNRAGTCVAALHAGWRGLVGVEGYGIVESGLHHVQATMPSPVTSSSTTPSGATPSPATEWLAWLGPCIGSQAFEVGDEVYHAFTRSQANSQQHFVPTMAGKWLADLAGLARQRLQALGVSAIYGNDGSPAWCTVGNASRFFSHRRDGGISGRMAACIWLQG